MIGITEYMHADLKGSKHPRKQKTQRKSAARPEGDAAATAVAAEGAGGSDAEEAGGGEGAGVHDEEGANEEEERLVAEAEAAAAEHTTDTFAIRRAAELFAGRPDLAAAYGRGWGQSKEWDRMCSTGEVDEVSPPAELPSCQLMWVLAVWRGGILQLRLDKLSGWYEG